MSYKRQTVTNQFLYDTQVENLFISEYMVSAPGKCVKAYLLALMYAELDRPYDSASLAEQLSVTEDELEECWDYWVDKGLVKRRTVSRGGRRIPVIEFVNIKEQLFGGAGEETSETEHSSLIDDELKQLYADIENACGRLLEGGEAEAVASWITDYGFKADLILRAYTFCAENRKSCRYKYVLTVLKDWKKHGVDSTEKAEEYLKDIDQKYKTHRQVLAQLGLHRNPTESEKQIIDSWFNEMGFDMDKVLEACNKTSGISNPNINYVNSVLKGWQADREGTSPAAKANMFARAQKLYEEDREENKRKAEKLKQQIYGRLPRVKEISDELAELSMKLSRSVLAGGSKTAQFRERTKALVEERNALLASAGYAADALDIHYNCPECRDTGLLPDGRRCSCFSRMMLRLSSADKEGK